MFKITFLFDWNINIIIVLPFNIPMATLKKNWSGPFGTCDLYYIILNLTLFPTVYLYLHCNLIISSIKYVYTCNIN